MQVDQKDDTDHRGSQGSDPGDSGSPSQPLASSKLRDKLQKFAEWRIDPSSIEFPADGPEFRGGFATVSRAFLVSTSSSESRADDSAQTGGENKSDGETPKRKAIAVKKLKIEDGKDKERILGLALREAGFLVELSHENVIRLEGFVEDLSEDRVWLVFPWADNGNLKDFVASANWEIPERLWLIDDVAGGVEYLHTQNPPISHGDLKSANVLVNSKYRAVITDFGSARRLTKKDPPVRLAKSKNGALPALSLETEFCEATNTVTLKGNQFTLRWAAPELLMEDEPGMEPGLWSDIWSLGWIFYEVMTGAIPFQNVKKDSVVVICVIQGNLPSVADHAGMVLVRALYSLMITCWSIDPSKRPTAEDCRRLMDWMPMIVPDPRRALNALNTQARSPKLLVELGNMHLDQNDYVNASKSYSEASAICTETADNEGKAEALFGLATIHKLQNNYSEAATFYSEVVQICSDTGDKQGRADGLWGLADVHQLQDEYSEAIPLYSEVVQICTEIGDRKGRADALRGLAQVHRLQGQNSQAVPLYSEAIQICTDIGNGRGRADSLRGLAYVHVAQDEYSKAAPLFSEAAQICTDIGDRQGRAEALWGLAEVHRLQDEYRKAISLYSEVAQICAEIGNRQKRADALWGLAEVHRSQDEYSEAVPLYSEAIQICTDISDRRGRAEALMGLADVHRDQDQHEDAIRLYEQAGGIFEEIGSARDAEMALNGAACSRQQLEPAEAE